MPLGVENYWNNTALFLLRVGGATLVDGWRGRSGVQQIDRPR